MDWNWVSFVVGVVVGAASAYLAAVFAGVDKKAEDEREEHRR